MKEAVLGVTHPFAFVQSMLITDSPINTTFSTTTFEVIAFSAEPCTEYDK